MKYFASMGYYKQAGMFDQVNYSRFNYSMNMESKVTKTTTVSLSLIGSVERTNDLDIASISTGTAADGSTVYTNQLFRNGYKFIPTEAVYFTNGLWGQYAGNSPVAILHAGYRKDDGNTLLSTIAIEQ